MSKEHNPDFPYIQNEIRYKEGGLYGPHGYVSSQVRSFEFVTGPFPLSTRINQAAIGFNTAEDDKRLAEGVKEQLKYIKENFKRTNL